MQKLLHNGRDSELKKNNSIRSFWGPLSPHNHQPRKDLVIFGEDARGGAGGAHAPPKFQNDPVKP